MAAAGPASTPAVGPGAVSSESSGVNRVIDGTLSLAKSWVGQLTAYIAAIAAAIVAFEKLPEHLKSAPLWQRVAVLAALPVLALVFNVIPELVERARRKRLTEITGHLQAGYFQLSPRDDEAVSPLEGLHNLTTLNLSFTKVSNVSPLKGLKNLTWLDLDLTPVRDVSPLKDLKNLKISGP